MRWRTNWKRLLRIHDPLARECLAEFLGTFILLLLGDAAVAQSVLSDKDKGEFISITIGWGVAVASGVYVSGGVSGGHINPAITGAMAVIGRMPLYKVCFYWLCQYLGALAGAAAVYGVYFDAINAFDGGDRQIDGPLGTGGIFCTYPQPFLSWQSALGDQIVATTILVIAALAITDKRNMDVSKGFIPAIIGSTVTGIGSVLSFNCGNAMNPARDLSPRIFTAMAGWGKEVFSYNDWLWFWIPVIGPHIGAVTGAWIYNYCIGVHWPDVAVPHQPREVAGLSTVQQHVKGMVNDAFLLEDDHEIDQMNELMGMKFTMVTGRAKEEKFHNQNNANMQKNGNVQSNGLTSR